MTTTYQSADIPKDTNTNNTNMQDNTFTSDIIPESDFHKVCEFNKCFDFPTHDDFSDMKCLNLRLDLIDEEIKELKQAYETLDLTEEKDACADILYVAYGMAYTYKYDSDHHMMTNFKHKVNDDNHIYTLFKSLEYDYTDKDRTHLLNKIYDMFYHITLSVEFKDIRVIMKFLHELIYYVYAFQYVSGYDSDYIFDVVHKSNMSKLCINEDEAIKTVNKYLDEYQKGVSPYDSPYYYQLENGLFVIKNKSSGKALKSINYTKVKL